MRYEQLRRRICSLAPYDRGCYYPPDDPRSRYTDENGWLNILVPGALTPKGERVGANYTHLVIDIPREKHEQEG